MRLKLIVPAILFAVLISQTVSADDLADLKAQLKIMQQQMQIMQNKLDAQEVVLNKQQQATQDIAHQQAVREKDKETRGVTHEIADSITMGGVIDVIANHSNSDGWSGNSSSDLILDTFELSIGASAGDWVSGSILFLYEDASDDNFLMDEVYITIANSEVTPFYASVGRLYVPFGNFESNMVSDPVTLTLGETRADVIQIGVETQDGLYGSAYVFNSDAEQASGQYSSTKNNRIDSFGLNLGYAMENDDFALDMGAGYINNIASSATLQGVVDGNALCAGDGCIKDYVGGISLHAVATFGQFNLIGEYVTALNEFKANEVSIVNSDKLKPSALNIEGAYNFEIAGKETTVALGYQKTQDMYFDTESSDFLEDAWLASISVGIIDNTTLAAEWKHAQAYSEVKDVVSDYDDEDFLQIKLSYEF
ncbi:MAG: LbtU family siderophore porin [gamma proteobacterium symbiont of Taylorina sp.]|nr:LbtU family siderophore porin [gamma proteobacterium symbiont of Taylorina sp.]